MSNSNNTTRISHCTCGKVSFKVEGEPIMTVACYCDSCQESGQQLEQLTDAPVVLEVDGSTDYVMCRKDRVSCLKGQDLLREHWLSADAPTRRIVASCCNSAMFLEFSKGHWLSMYRHRFDPTDQPAIEMRTMTVNRKPDVEFDDDIPSPDKHTFGFMWKLMKAWVAMGFKVPKIDYIKGNINN